MFLSGCLNNSDYSSTNDPFKKINKNTHAFNKSLDKNVLKPASKVYGYSTPETLRNVLSNFSSNLSEPLNFVNHVLQGNLTPAATTSLRFSLNSTVGVIGLFDIASYLNIEEKATSFDTTFSAWNIPPGPYVELPLLGPSSFRGSVATIVDFTIDPVSSSVTSGYNFAYYSAAALNLLNSRYELGNTIDTVLHESFDSYETTKNYYFQSLNVKSLSSLDDELYEMYLDE